MNVIITHEQADFDALASLLGACITHPDTLPVLPQKTNRNVADFLKMFTSSFLFQEVSDLPKENIEQVTLVDTQSLITIKGTNRNTKVRVIDHHNAKKDLPADWDFQFVPYGAATTFFVKKIQAEGVYDLNAMEATLLLLGIYEDTGSLTYTNTTPHDASAIAYLLSKNANLEIAASFLNPPLSSAQQAVFQKLLEQSRHINIYDLNILIASANALELEDEISSIAHKMNNLFEPDALFLLTKLKEGIRFVARSSTNRVDVAKIAQRYGGGGHRRASAALLKNDDKGQNNLKSFEEDLETVLRDQILPAVRVRNIMSKKPLILSPKTSVDEARTLMERYGYEGFPVIKDNKIIGLLKRRAVDKALTHHLDKTAFSLMEAGNFSVSKNDTLEELQQVMSESGWGQIPVVSKSSGEIIGIVTRTDLLKAITGNGQDNHHRNLAGAIKENTSIGEYQLLDLISQTAAEVDLPIYIVGGFVRDLLLETASPDFDIVVEGDALRLSEMLSSKFGGKVTSHKKFGTAKWWPREKNSSANSELLPIQPEHLDQIPAALDLISARTEFYEKPTALPTIKQSSIKLDLHRRDFTINTMAIRLDGDHFGDLYDYWGGLNDLENGLVRVLHSLSFVDDPTRMLRAVRFEKRFDFEIEIRTLELLTEAVSLLDNVSGDRIRHELDQIFYEKESSKMLQRLHGLGILERIDPAIIWRDEFSEEIRKVKESRNNDLQENGSDQKNQDLANQTYVILLCRLATQDLNRVIKRLRFRKDIRQIISAANALWHNQEMLSKLSPGDFTEKIEKYPILAINTLLLIANDPDFRSKLEKYAADWKHITIETSGNDLRKLDIPPGPIYHQMLRRLRIAKINGDITDQTQEKEMLQQLIQKMM